MKAFTIKVINPSLCSLIHKRLFELGYSWWGGDKDDRTDGIFERYGSQQPIISVNEDGGICFGTFNYALANLGRRPIISIEELFAMSPVEDFDLGGLTAHIQRDYRKVEIPSENVELSFDDIQRLVKLLTIPTIKFSKWEITIDKVKVGCKSLSMKKILELAEKCK